MFQTKVVEKIKTHILCSVTFFWKSCRLWDILDKLGTARQATDDKIIRRMRFACRITKATDTLLIFNTYCFSTATMVTRKRLNFTFYVHCPSCVLSGFRHGVSLLLFCDVTKRRLLVSYRCFGTTYRSHFGLRDAWRWDRVGVPKRQ
jgi:hypothetical protein